MIFKKQILQPDRKAHPVIGLILFLISVVLLLVTGPLGFLYGILHALVKKGFKGLGEYLLQIAISIDQLGNVLMQHLLHLLWVKKGGYPFGNRDETISSALGRNRQLGTLTRFGLAIDAFLDRIDPDHSLNSIDYYIEPNSSIMDRLSWICIRDHKVLFLKKKGQPQLFLPGGSREAGQSDVLRLAGFLSSLLGITAIIDEAEYLGTFESRYLQHLPVTFLRQHLYRMPYQGELKPGIDLEGPFWIGYPEREQLTGADGLVLEALKEKGLLNET